MIELEKTYLAKSLPNDIKNHKSKEVIDIYIPKDHEHPSLRIRKNGNNYEATKKEPVKDGDASIQKEQTIMLREDEFEALSKLDGKKLRKIRYFYKTDNYDAEIDVFQDELEGLVLVDVEFEIEDDKDEFEMPDFCLKDVTQEKFIAGGMLCGKSYEEIEEKLNKLGYDKIFLEK